MTDLSVVIPVYNEADAVETLVEDLGRELLPIAADLEAILVDDASTDATPAILDRLAADRPWLHVHHAERNAGHGASVLRGLALARADWIFQLDSDGQFVVAEFDRLWMQRQECDLALGVRTVRHDPQHRLLLTRVVRYATTLLAGRHVRDANTPFRLLRRSLWEEVAPLIAPSTLAPNISVTLAATVLGKRVVEVPVTHLPRETGRVSLRTLRLVRFSARGLAQLIRFRLRLSRVRRGAGGGR
jgi:glycosyltransferase involved in cell wall biosynthesis